MRERLFKVQSIGSNVSSGFDKLNLQKGDVLDFLSIMEITDSKYFNFQGGETYIYQKDNSYIIQLKAALLDNYYIEFRELGNY